MKKCVELYKCDVCGIERIVAPPKLGPPVKWLTAKVVNSDSLTILDGEFCSMLCLSCAIVLEKEKE